MHFLGENIAWSDNFVFGKYTTACPGACSISWRSTRPFTDNSPALWTDCSDIWLTLYFHRSPQTSLTLIRRTGPTSTSQWEWQSSNRIILFLFFFLFLRYQGFGFRRLWVASCPYVPAPHHRDLPFFCLVLHKGEIPIRTQSEIFRCLSLTTTCPLLLLCFGTCHLSCMECPPHLSGLGEIMMSTSDTSGKFWGIFRRPWITIIFGSQVLIFAVPEVNEVLCQFGEHTPRQK